MTQADIAAECQLANAGEIVTLYVLDATNLGGGVYRFTHSTNDNQPVVFGGETYTAIDVQSDGWEHNGKGTLPTPRFRITNVNKLMLASTITYNDLIGAKLTRIRTFKKFLDGEAGANPDAYFMPDIFQIEQKTEMSKFVIEWELSAVIDQEGRQLPGRQYIKDACTHIYRVYRGGAFVYTKASCPYNGTSYFLKSGDATTDPVQDSCGKRLSDCRLRFGDHGNLPFRGFPGLGNS